MSDANQYPYPLNTTDPYSGRGNPDEASEMVTLDWEEAQVIITKGPLKGYTGKLSGYTNDGIYFIRGDWDGKESGRTPVHYGPFLRDEFEVH